ncbi:hypothetical protein B296_00057086 [Ensete ventricosum]|uniref:Uncharacterized protein n=1 Tax=Ensete ventricosum TaxID=4639 RepID=A0A426XSR5_ENSVE|nr:hypothetical protein B296_00057086 [Ensete ventricosum]
MRNDLDGVVGADVILVDGLEPADIVVSVRHEVDVELPGDDAPRRVVGDVGGVRKTPPRGQNKEQVMKEKKRGGGGDRHGR